MSLPLSLLMKTHTITGWEGNEDCSRICYKLYRHRRKMLVTNPHANILMYDVQILKYNSVERFKWVVD
jgi:hypothetical protein